MDVLTLGIGLSLFGISLISALLVTLVLVSKIVKIHNNVSGPSKGDFSRPIVWRRTTDPAYGHWEDVSGNEVVWPFGLPVVNLYPAGGFICDSCGRNNYLSLVNLEDDGVSEDEADVLYETIGYRKGEGRLCCIPATGQCDHCKAVFALYDGPPSADPCSEHDCH